VASVGDFLKRHFHLRVRRGLLEEYAVLNVFAVVIGILAGLAALGFRYLIWGFQSLFYNGGVPWGSPWQDTSMFDVPLSLYTGAGLWVFVVLSLGGLAVGLLTYRLAPEARGHGVPEVMEAVQTRGGRLRPRITVIKALASAITISSGGSAGRHGPVVTIGSAIGSGLAQRFQLSDTRMKVLVGCGAAAAISATFNAPIAGVLFALEVILLEFKTRSFVPLAISSVFAATVMSLFVPSGPLFPLPYEFLSPWELLSFALLGLLAGAVAILFIGSLYWVEDGFQALKVPPWARPALGGLLIGALILLIPQVLGVGDETLREVLTTDFLSQYGTYAILFALLFLFAKILATSITVGSGGSGGVFAPSLFIGAMLGGTLGITLNAAFPGVTNEYGAYALVGMGAVFAAATRATLTAIVMIFELTGDYKFILPLMFATVIADMVTFLAYEDTIYTKKLRRKGLHLESDLETRVLRRIPVGDAMVTQVKTVIADMSVKQLADTVILTGFQAFPVLDERGRLQGIVTHKDVSVGLRQDLLQLTARDLVRRDQPVTFPDEDLEVAAQKMARGGTGHLLVVKRDDREALVGLLTSGDIMKRYRLTTMGEGRAD
jgi:CIC family chloride channel protein